MLIHSASQVVTLAGGPRRGPAPVDPGIIVNGAVLVREGLIAAVGTTQDLLARYPDEQGLDASGKTVLPGFVDPHTHLVWAGDRAAEFEMRLQGKTYMEIMATGGGINATVSATRQAKPDELYHQTRKRVLNMFRYGTTTAEAKTGYGLELTTELAQLEVLLRLNEEGPIEIAPTFMPAHAVPLEYKGREEEYTRLVCDSLLPEAAHWWRQRCPGRPLPFVDVFCEAGAFDLAQSRRILTRARDLGYPLKAHVDEFKNLGGAALAVELGAVSIEHAVKTSAAEIQTLGGSDTVIVSLPCTPFGLAEPHYTPARAMLAAGATLALATDLNPGTAWCENMQFVIALACRTLKLTPAEALAAATINAARAIRREQHVGSIEAGKQADLLILSVPDYRQLAYRFGGSLVQGVIKKGRLTRVA
ncbi:MAG TPA: imidazolonepropionase [Anaerolineaceae bacterium]|nr:imidazolonepropionase [Anaerolineaceae bacterium]